MANEQDVDKTLIQIESDLASINRTIRDIDKVRDAQKRLADDAKKAALVGEQSSKRLVKAYENVKKAAEAAAKANAKAAAKPLTADDRFGEVSRNVGLFGDVETGLRTVGVGGAAPEIFAVAEAIPRLKVALQGIPEQAQLAAAALGPGGLAVGGVLLALGAAAAILTNEINIAREATRKRIEAEIDYNRLVAGETQDSLELKLNAIRKEIDLQQKNVDTAQAANDAAFQQYENATGLFDKLTATQQYDEAGRVLDEQIVKLSDLEKQESELLRARNDLTVASNTAEEAERRLAAARQKEADALVNTTIATYQKAQSLNSEQAKERLDALAAEIETIERFSQTIGQSEENKAALQARLDNLETEYGLLQSLLPTLIAHNDELERQAKELAESEKAFQATAAAMKDFSADIAAIEERTANERLAIQERLTQAAIDLEEKRGAALTAKTDALIEADAAAAKERADIERQANNDRADENERFQERLKEIDRSFQSARKSALESRDVLALKDARAARDEAKREENKANQDRLSEIEKTLTEQNQAVDDKLKEQTAAVEKRYQEQVDAAKDASAKQVDAARADLAAIDSKYNAEILKRNQHHVAELNLINTHYLTREALERQHLERLNQLAQQYLFQGGTTIAPTANTGTVIPFASGGNAPANRLLLTGEKGPELIRLPQGGFIHNANQTRDMMNGGGINVTIPLNIGGGTKRRDIIREVQTEVERHLDKVLREAGY